jgi:Rrf2 family cysteine metabolism transcriptional repressor
MISITTKSPYALQALAELGRAGDAAPVPIGELARRRDIPVQFLEQLFAALRRAGILRSQRGVKGGYSFARPPSEVTVLELVELLDGPLGAQAACSRTRPPPPVTCWRRRRCRTSSTARPATPARRCTTSDALSHSTNGKSSPSP